MNAIVRRTSFSDLNNMDEWKADFFSNYKEDVFLYGCVSESYIKCIPYNEQTKHLLGTKNDI
jgi:hypothetical protein